jgi:hypothetical protein
MRFLLSLPLLLCALIGSANAQFQFFEQMFGGGHQHQQQPQNVPSDSSIYRANYERATCDKYLCPDTLGMLFTLPQTLCLATRHLQVLQHASTTHTIAPAHGRRTRTSLN